MYVYIYIYIYIYIYHSQVMHGHVGYRRVRASFRKDPSRSDARDDLNNKSYSQRSCLRCAHRSCFFISLLSLRIRADSQ